VDIRITNHNSILDWAEYGFNQPVVDEYLRRYGVDPQVDSFDKEKLRRLRGEFYTAFLEKAAALWMAVTDGFKELNPSINEIIRKKFEDCRRVRARRN